tara:strand:- start:3056 stop:4351 length:1296 start_codon:yes stop_codon:yes gene_type:complete
VPSTDLKALREYVANVLDYDPTNENYKRQIDRFLNEADRIICLAKPFSFINKAVDKVVYADRTGFLACALGSRFVTTVTTPTSDFFEDWMVNQEVEIDGKTYTITYVENSKDAHLDRDIESATGTYSSVVMNRYIDLPDDCTSILGIARRSNTRTPNDPGLLSPLARYEDEWYNLPLGEVNLPIYWVPHDPAYIAGPRKNFDVAAVVAAPPQGVRTLEFTSTFIRNGRESSPGEVVSITPDNGQTVKLTPYTTLKSDGLRKRYYFRAPTLGYQAWRFLTDVGELAPDDATPVTLLSVALSDLTEKEDPFLQPRLGQGDGFIRRVRLYPRQDKDYTFTIRYMQNPPPMVEDNDTSAVPPDQRMVIAYKALADILMKHDNMTQSELYRRRFDEELLRLEKRYLISPSRRIVKGNWLANMEPNSFSRFTTLVHT